MEACSTINLRVLSACSAFASKDEARYYLNGVCVEIDARGVTYVATDGARLIAYRDTLDIEGDDNLLLGTFIIPTIHCKHFKITKDGDARARMFGTGRLTIAYGFVDVTFMAIDGVYPDWRRTIPVAPPTGEVAQFNLKFIADLHKFCRELDFGVPFIAHNGVAPAPVWFPGNPQTLGVLMPIRTSDEMAHPVPEWARQGPPRAQADIEDAA